jgi:hypothetical protein
MEEEERSTQGSAAAPETIGDQAQNEARVLGSRRPRETTEIKSIWTEG